MERKNNLTYIPRSLAVLLIVILLCSVFFTGCTAGSTQEEVVIGIAWRADTDSEFYTNIVAAVEEAGGKPVRNLPWQSIFRERRMQLNLWIAKQRCLYSKH